MPPADSLTGALIEFLRPRRQARIDEMTLAVYGEVTSQTRGRMYALAQFLVHDRMLTRVERGVYRLNRRSLKIRGQLAAEHAKACAKRTDLRPDLADAQDAPPTT